MSRAIAAIHQGLHYQARFFWANAATRLLARRPQVHRVGFDVDDFEGFDDVVVDFGEPERDQLGRSIRKDHYQVKFHMDHGGALTAAALMDPAAIGAKKQSLLQRLQAAVARLGSDAQHTRLFLVTTDPVDRQDALARLISSTEHGIRLKTLLSGGPRSAMGRLRAALRQHLGLDTDEELVEILKPLRLVPSAPDFNALNAQLKVLLPAAGILPPSGDGAVSSLESLVWRLHSEGTYYFTAEALRAECARAGLTADSPVEGEPRPLIGLRSFNRFGVELADQADHLLSLLDRFDGRFLVDEMTWPGLLESIRAFLLPLATENTAFDLHLDVHASLAYAAGSLLPPKCGLDLRIRQFSRGGSELWPAMPTTAEEPGLVAQVQPLGLGSGLGLALALTQDIAADVRIYTEKEGLPIDRLLTLAPAGGASQNAVRNGAHALAIADHTAREVTALRRIDRSATLHLFSAAPNALVFFLGQLAQSLGPVQLYEHDFEGIRGGSYAPSLRLPAP